MAGAAGIESVTLGWDDPSDSTIKGYQYLYTTDDGTNSGVVDIPDSAPGEDNATSYTVTGLTSGLLHTIFLRAVGSGGNRPPSDSVTATPVRLSGPWTHEMALDPTMITVGAGIGAVPTYRATFHVDSDQVSSVASLSAETTAGELGLSLDDGVEGSVVVGLVDGAAADPNAAEMADSKLFSGPPPRIVLQT